MTTVAHKFTLYVSHDCGCNYGIAKTADSIGELSEYCDTFDEQMLRWCIEDWDGNLVDVSSIHKSIISTLVKLNERH